jgi:cytoskeletal protein RodZ
MSPKAQQASSYASPQALFVFRLRLHRERRRLTLDQIARLTRVRRELFEALEQNDLSLWPRGLYARAWIRQYSTLVGLDPEETVDEFCRLFPNGDRRVSTALRELAALVSQHSEYRDERAREVERRRTLSPRLPVDASGRREFRKQQVVAFR